MSFFWCLSLFECPILSFGDSLYYMTVDGEIINSVQNLGQSQVRINTSKPLSHPHKFQLPLKLLFVMFDKLASKNITGQTVINILFYSVDFPIFSTTFFFNFCRPQLISETKNYHVE